MRKYILRLQQREAGPLKEKHSDIEVTARDLELIADGLSLLDPIEDDETDNPTEERCEELAAKFRALRAEVSDGI